MTSGQNIVYKRFLLFNMECHEIGFFLHNSLKIVKYGKKDSSNKL